jgi:hypothetical protein
MMPSSYPIAETFEDDTFIISTITTSFQGDYIKSIYCVERRIKMKPDSILNTDQYTKIVIKREDDDTVVAVITEDDVEPSPNYIAVLTPNYD